MTGGTQQREMCTMIEDKKILWKFYEAVYRGHRIDVDYPELGVRHGSSPFATSATSQLLVRQ